MSRKDYERIAAALRAARDEYLPTDCELRGVDTVAHALAGTLATENPRFDHDRFIAAAGARP